MTDTTFPWYGNEPNEENTYKHIAKIAWFIKYGFNNPIELDVGIPEMCCHVDYIVVDGNHRLASSIYKEEVQGTMTLVPCSINGSLDYAEELLQLNKRYP